MTCIIMRQYLKIRKEVYKYFKGSKTGHMTKQYTKATHKKTTEGYPCKIVTVQGQPVILGTLPKELLFFSPIYCVCYKEIKRMCCIMLGLPIFKINNYTGHICAVQVILMHFKRKPRRLTGRLPKEVLMALGRNV